MKNIVVVVLFVAFIFVPIQTFAYKVGVVTDVHAGKNFVRDYRNKQNRSNILYPKRYNKSLKKALTDMKLQGAEMVVFNGDNTNKDTPSYAINLLKMANASGMESIWVKGNHDLRKTSKYYKCSISNSSYYFRDREGWRIIVLDSNYAKPNGWGGVDDPQVEWLKTAIAEATGSVIVFMHHPIFMINEKRPDEIYPGYTYLESALSESGKVKYVVSGHVHVPTQFSKTYNGVQYFVNVPLTLKGRLNSYQIMDLPSL